MPEDRDVISKRGQRQAGGRGGLPPGFLPVAAVLAWRAAMNGYYVQNIRADWTIKKVVFSEWHIIGQVNNLFNKKYEPNGYTYSYIAGNVLTNENGYYPMAGTNYMLGVNIKL